MDKTGFIQLLDKYITHSITVEERKQLSQLLKDPSYHTELEAIIDQQLAGNTFEMPEDESIRHLIFERIEQARKNKHGRVRTMFLTWRRIAVAASVLLLVGLGSYFLFFNKTNEQTKVPVVVISNDVKAPETNRAMVTLANGQQVFLDSVTNGQLAIQGNVKLVKLADGQIAYQSTVDGQQSTVQYNTLNNPRGSKVIDMTLADGSRVWLNSGSSVTYPVAFVGKERKVSITGEAYFEVAPSVALLANGQKGKRPFIVNAQGMEIEVLGTHFNVNSYTDEDAVKTTLLEGKVRIQSKATNAQTMLAPGEQARFDKQTQALSKAKDVDVDAEVAWRFGMFQFNNADLKTVMRQLERWYDVEVQYSGAVPDREFIGTIPRSLNLSKVLTLLEKQNVHFTIDGKKIIVTP